MYTTIDPSSSAAGLRIGIAVSRYHEPITDALRDGAMARFSASGGRDDDLTIVPSPGTFELIAICYAMARRGSHDAIVALGCVITGETTHDRYIAQAVARGLGEITIATMVPVTFGVLTCQSLTQARERAGGRVGNKGEEAMAAAIEVANVINQIAASRGECRA